MSWIFWPKNFMLVLNCSLLASVLPRPDSLWVLLFPELKSALKGYRFDGTNGIQTNSLIALQDISQEVFQDYFMKWKHRWENVYIGENSTLKGTRTICKLNLVNNFRLSIYLLSSWLFDKICTTPKYKILCQITIFF